MQTLQTTHSNNPPAKKGNPRVYKLSQADQENLIEIRLLEGFLRPIVPVPLGGNDKTVEQLQENTKRLENMVPQMTLRCMNLPLKMRRKLRFFNKPLPKYFCTIVWQHVINDLNVIKGWKV